MNLKKLIQDEFPFMKIYLKPRQEEQSKNLKKLGLFEIYFSSFENKYFKELMPICGTREQLSAAVLKKCALEILNIDVDRSKIATAKISMKVDDTIYIDILSLQKINNVWKRV